MEAVTTASVTTALRHALGRDVRCTSLTRGPIGNGQETWFVEVVGVDSADRQDLVLRRTAAAGPLEWTDRRAEAAAMASAAAAGLPVPRVHALVEDEAVLGAPFMVLERMPGEAVSRAPRPVRQELTADLLRRLAAYHRRARRDADGRDALTATRTEIARAARRYRRQRLAPLPLLDGLLAWLEVAIPPALAATPAVLLWGDAGPHNALGADGRITAVLDWELAHVGHPLEDLATVLWMSGAPVDSGSPLVSAYADAAGAPVDLEVLRYFRVLVAVTRSIMIIGGGAAFAAGRTHAPNLAGLAIHLPLAALGAAAADAGWGEDPPWPQPEPLPDTAAVLPGPHPAVAATVGGLAVFFEQEVVDVVTEPLALRGTKTAVALLQTAALRARLEPQLQAERERADAALLAEVAPRLGDVPDLAVLADAVEREPSAADLRGRVRAHLLADLTRQRRLATPLHALYAR